jgi:ABC-type multidrug transport system fused ATPase/permease subunit
MQSKTRHLMLWRNDPLLYFFKEKLRFSSLDIVLCLTGAVAIAVFGLGWIADYSYAGSGIRFIEPAFYSQMLAFFVFGLSIAVGFYVWQPGAIVHVLKSLEQTGVIQAVSEQGSRHIKSYPDFLIQLQAAIDSRKWAVISTVFALGFCAFEALVALPATFHMFGRSAFWYDVRWFRVVVLAAFFVWLYVIFMISLKLLQAILYFNRLFQWFDVRIRPLHPDEAGGLGALGSLTWKTSLTIVGVGAAAAVYSVIDWLAGANPLARPDLLIFWASYILATPISLIVPMLSAHRAMQQARNEKLNEIAQEFDKTLSDAAVTKTGDADAIKKANEKLQELQTRYEIVATSLPTWPIPARLFRNFSITASLPLLSGLASMVINFATK